MYSTVQAVIPGGCSVFQIESILGAAFTDNMGEIMATLAHASALKTDSDMFRKYYVSGEWLTRLKKIGKAIFESTGKRAKDVTAYGWELFLEVVVQGKMVSFRYAFQSIFPSLEFSTVHEFQLLTYIPLIFAEGAMRAQRCGDT